MTKDIVLNKGFNTQPPEGGWSGFGAPGLAIRVSTHSRLKAAGDGLDTRKFKAHVSTHSRLKAAGYSIHNQKFFGKVSTHSRLKAAGYNI